MKTQKLLGLLITLTMLLTLVGTVSAAPAEKVNVCHYDKELNTFVLINISDNAYPAHQEHGDAYAGDPVPGQTQYHFGADCSLVEQYTFVQTLYVTSESKTVTVSSPLIEGQLYELRARGAYHYQGKTSIYPNGFADAKYSYRSTTIGWLDGAQLWDEPALSYGLQVTIKDGDTEKPLLPAYWSGSFNDAHIYTAAYTGTGFSLGLFIWDNVYTDNLGEITVDIYKVNW